MWVYRASWVVGVDDDDCLAAWGDLRFKVVQIRQPAVFLVAKVMYRASARQAGGCCPQWIVRCRDEHLVTVVKHRLQRDLDQLADPVAEPHVIDGDASDATRLIVLHNGGPRG